VTLIATSEVPVLETRQLTAAGRNVAVQLFRNESGSFSARCVFGQGDTPIIDGPTKEAVLEIIENALEALLFTRAWSRG
jgi:hypothetical protein